MKKYNIPEQIRQLNQWVCVKKDSKVPMQVLINYAASPSDESTWCDFETASNAVEKGIYDNLGFVFNNNGIVGIDIDCGFDDNGFFSDVSIDIALACKSYCEKSRSGRGIHILVKGKLPFNGRNNRNGVEIYQTGRYFITTGEVLVYKNIVENQEAIDYIIQKYFPLTEKDSTSNSEKGYGKIYEPIVQKPVNGIISLKPQYPPIPSGCRNQSLTSLAGQLYYQGYNKEYIYKELLYCNSIACTPPLLTSEIETIVNSVSRYRR